MSFNKMNSKDDYSELDSEDTDFEEQPARELVYLILQNDVKTFRKFLPEVKKLDSNSFKNMFNANKKYDYDIKDKDKFNFLLTKFENFKFLLDEWYEYKDKHCYINELWKKYISIESLRDKKEKEIEDFLSEKKINYKSWPQIIKDEFLNIIQNTKDTIIFSCKKSFEQFPTIMKNLLGKLYSISEYCKKNENDIFSKIVINQILIIAKQYLKIDKEKLEMLSDTIIDLVSNFSQDDKVTKLAIEASGLIFDIFSDDYSEIMEGNTGQIIASVLYSAMSFSNLYNSYENYKMTKAQMEKVKEYKSKIDVIEKNFLEHKKIIDNLSDKNILDFDIKKFNEELIRCAQLLYEDKEKIVKLILELKEIIEEKKRQKNSAILNIVTSGLKVAYGIVGVALTKGSVCTFNAIGAGVNGMSLIFDGIRISDLKEMIENLEKTLSRAKDIERKINNELQKLREKINENMEASPTFC